MHPSPLRSPVSLFVTLMLLFFVPMGAATAAEAPGQVLHEGSFVPADLTWDLGEDGGLIPRLADIDNLGEPGLPDLPVREMLLVVPLDARVKGVQVEALASHVEKVDGALSLAGARYTDSGEMVTVSDYDKAAGQFPAAWSEYAGVQVWRGYKLLALRIFPMMETDAGLEFLDRYAVRVEWERGDEPDVAQRLRRVPGELERTKDTLRKVVANPETLDGIARESGALVAEPAGGFQPTSAPSLMGSAIGYLIVTTDEMEAEFQRLADFKTARGLPTVVVTKEFILANSRRGVDSQETIRMFCRDAYEQWGIEYVLLGGDTDVFPARFVENSYYPTIGSTWIPVDMYYACLDGNWNANGNDHFGEPYTAFDGDDETDFAEEVYFGRAAVSDAGMAAVFVDKVITYESTPAETGWPNRALFAAEVLFPEDYPIDDYITMDGSDFAEDLIDDFLIPCTDMEYTRMYETFESNPGDADLTRAALIDTLNLGHYGIFNQIGHGFYFNMSVGDANFMNSDADNLRNGDALFLMYSLNCASAAFDYSCLMERLVQNPGGGSVASIGASRAAFPTTSDKYQREFFSHLFCGEENRLGNLIALSRLPYLAATYNNLVDRWTFENYTLLGDPSLRVWTGVPAGLALGVPTSVGLGPQSFAVTVVDSVGPVDQAVVTLQKNGEDFASGLTDPSGSVTLDFLPVSPGEITVTVSGDNLSMTTATIPVTGSGPYLAVTDLAPMDDGSSGSMGNGNSVIDAGETVALLPTLLETNGAPASGLTGVLTTTEPGVTILSGATTFPDVSAGGTTVGTTPFVVEFDSDLGDRTEAVFQLTVNDDSAGVHVSEWTCRLAGPAVEVVSMDWEDTVYGNGDNMTDGNEQLGISLRIKNFGSGLADVVTARLRSDDANVDVVDSVTVFTNVASMQDVNRELAFSLEIHNITRAAISRVVLEDNYGRTSVHVFDVTRPSAPLNIEIDTSLGPDVIGLSWDLVPDAAGYNVLRSLAAMGPFYPVNVDLAAGTSYYRDEGLDLLTRYYYKIQTVDGSLMPSAPSEMATASTAPSELPGFPVAFGDETSGVLGVGDVDGDGFVEIVLAAEDVYVWHHDGSELLDGDDNSQSLGPVTNENSVFQPAGIVLAHLDDEGGREIVVCERGNAQLVHVLRKDGTPLPGWPKNLAGPAGTDWNWSTPAVGDVDGDGEPEIVVNTLNGIVWVWHADGTELRDGDNNAATDGYFYFRPGAEYEWSMSGPALVDLDGDDALDIVFGTANDATGTKRLMAIRYDGTDVPGFPYITGGGAIGCHPAVGDLNNDGMVEIVFWDSWKRIYVVQGDGTNYSGFPKSVTYGSSLSFISSPALGDVDDDGQLEICVVLDETGDLGRVLLLDTDVAGGTSGDLLPGWPQVLPGSSEGSPVIGDVNGDGSPDIVHGIGGGSEDAPDNLYAFNVDGSLIEGFPITLGGPLRTAPHIQDVDYDGDVDIVYGGWDRLVHVWDMPFPYDRKNCPWPMFKANMERTSVILGSDVIGVGDEGEVPPSRLQVGAPYPNPFNPVTKVRFYVPGDGTGVADLRLEVFDLKGRLVRTLHSGAIEAGWHTVTWDGIDDGGRTQSSGLYFLRARSGASASIHKMTLVK